MNASQRLGLPFIQPGQAQKELFHNEALQALDVLVAGAVEVEPLAAPPASPVAGTCYIIGDSPTGEWAGKPGQVAAFTAAGWRYLAPVEGMAVAVRSTGTTACYRGGAWEIGIVRASGLFIDGDQIVGQRGSAIADPVGGTVIDAEARTAIGAIIAALRQHGLIAT